jgi:hypothetical protein
MFKAVPGGFIPTQDKLYLIGGVKMPEGSLAGAHRCGDPQNERNRDEYRRRGLCGRVSGAERAAVHQYAEYRDGLLGLKPFDAKAQTHTIQDRGVWGMAR